MCSLLAHGYKIIYVQKYITCLFPAIMNFTCYLFADNVYSMYHVWLIAKSVSWHVHVHLVHK